MTKNLTEISQSIDKIIYSGNTDTGIKESQTIKKEKSRMNIMLRAILVLIAAIYLPACQTVQKKTVQCKSSMISPFKVGIQPRVVDNSITHKWDKPFVQKVWRTTYTHDEKKVDKGTAGGQTSGCFHLNYPVPGTLGMVSTPKRFGKGGIAVMETDNGAVYYFLIGDRGTAVESGKAAKISGITKEQRNSPVFDFFLEQPLWDTDGAGPFATVTVYPYIGSKPFKQLTAGQRLDLQFLAQVKTTTMSDRRFFAKQ